MCITPEMIRLSPGTKRSNRPNNQIQHRARPKNRSQFRTPRFSGTVLFFSHDKDAVPAQHPEKNPDGTGNRTVIDLAQPIPQKVSAGPEEIPKKFRGQQTLTKFFAPQKRPSQHISETATPGGQNFLPAATSSGPAAKKKPTAKPGCRRKHSQYSRNVFYVRVLDIQGLIFLFFRIRGKNSRKNFCRCAGSNFSFRRRRNQNGRGHRGRKKIRGRKSLSHPCGGVLLPQPQKFFRATGKIVCVKIAIQKFCIFFMSSAKKTSHDFFPVPVTDHHQYSASPGRVRPRPTPELGNKRFSGIRMATTDL